MSFRWLAVIVPLLFTLAAAAQEAPRLELRRLPDALETTWEDSRAVLEEADSPGGPWRRLLEATSPHRVQPGGSARFFRLLRGRGADVVGSLFTPYTTPDGTTRPVQVPGVSVHLVHLATGAKGPAGVTDANGNFILIAQGPGRHRVCWEAPGFVSGCSTQEVVLVDDIVYLRAEPIEVRDLPGSQSLFGQVRFPDGAPLRRRDAFYGLDYATAVRLEALDGKPISAATPNSRGYYVLTNVPVVGLARLRVEVEGLQVEAQVDLGRAGFEELLLPNRRPEIRRVYAMQDGEEVSRVAPGSTVTLVAEAVDADGHPLAYHWVPSLRQGGFVSQNAGEVDWQLPSSEGVHVMHVLVRDNFGGHATARVRLSTASHRLFTGTVLDESGAPVPEASVRMGAAATATDSRGSFTLFITNRPPPFLLDITKPGFAPLSRVFEEETTGASFTFLQPATFSVEAGADSTLSDPRGTELFLPGRSLYRADGQAVVDPVTVRITTVDPCQAGAESPVSTRVAGAAGVGREFFSSFSTAYVAAHDASGAPLQVKAGSAARLFLPLSSACRKELPEPPATLGAWAYNPQAGAWSPDGEATYQPPSAGGAIGYLLTATSVSLHCYKAVDPVSPISIVQLHVDRSIALPYDVIVVGPTFSYRRTVFHSPTPFTFPGLTPVTFRMLDHRQAPGAHYTNMVTASLPMSVNAKTVNLQLSLTSPPPNVTTNVTLRLGSVLAPLLTQVEAAEAFLEHNYGTGDAVTASNYYAAIDPTGARTTLAGWKAANGFNTGAEASAVYFNAGDLGFGRSMHMKRKVGADSAMDVAFYVSNHDTVDHARTGFGLIATVAMEYALDPAHPTHGRYTKFFVFDASGNRVDRVNLDNNGDKFVPNLCLICHGGNHGVSGTAATGWNLGAKFIPFDMESYTYSTASTATPSAQHNAFRTMNLAIRDHTGPTPSVVDLVNGWYGPGGTNGFNKNYVPAAWAAPADLAIYRDVVKPACRACHTTRSLDFTTPMGGVDFCGYNVCDIFVMPDAQRTFSLFWGSKTANVGGTGTPPNMPTLLHLRYGVNYGSNPCP
ncbi:MAG: hypothetical protein RJA22_2032 [Verrucomicrobiota bacterium]